MKAIIHILISAILLSSCSDDPCFKGSGDDATVTRQLSEQIDSLYIYHNLDVDIYFSDQNYIEIEGGKNVVEFVKSETEGTSLKLENQNSCDFLRNFDQDIKVRLYLKSLITFEYYGSGTITFHDSIEGSQFWVRSFGASGTTNLLLNTTGINLQIEDGTSDVNITGKSRNLSIYMTGSSVVNASDMDLFYCGVVTESTGDCKVCPVNGVECTLRAIGDIGYVGKPDVKVLEHTGTGKIYSL